MDELLECAGEALDRLADNRLGLKLDDRDPSLQRQSALVGGGWELPSDLPTDPVLDFGGGDR